MTGSDVAGLISAINSKDNGSGFGQNWIWIIGLLIVAGIFGGGFGNGFFGGRNEGPIIMPNNNESLTRQDLCQDMNFQSLENSVRGIQNGLCDGFYAQNTTMLNGFNNVGTQVANVGSQMQSCCCETNRNIDAVRYENAQNTCSIITNANENTQKILDKMCQYEIQGLRDKVVEQNSEIQSRDFQLSQLNQTNTLLGQINKTPIPAYITCSPYMSSYYAYNGLSGLNGCGC